MTKDQAESVLRQYRQIQFLGDIHRAETDQLSIEQQITADGPEPTETPRTLSRPAWMRVLHREGYCRISFNSDRPATLTCSQGFLLTLYRDYLSRNGFTLIEVCRMFRKADSAPINPENLWKHPERALPFPKRVADALNRVT